jgi:hypothetical protein
MIYLVLVVILIILSYVEAILKSKIFSNYFLIIFSFVLVLFAGLRDNVGTDWDAYFDFYKYSTDKVEIGYATLNNFFGSLSISYNIFLLFINGVSIILLYKFLEKNTVFKIVSILMFFSNLYLYFNLSGIRQAIAISITCFSFTYALNKNPVKFFLLVLLASTFHITATSFLFIYFLPRNKLKVFQIFIYLICFILIYFFLSSITDLIALYSLKDANYYINIQEKSESLGQLYIIGIAVRSVILGMIFYTRKNLNQIENFTYILNIYLFGLVIYITTYMISPDIGVRISSYYTIFDLIIAGNLIYNLKNLSSRIYIVTIFSIIALYKIFGYMGSEYYVYKFIF